MQPCKDLPKQGKESCISRGGGEGEREKGTDIGAL